MEVGKIPHEIRHGELAQLGILPFQPYYGTHDATSLFISVLSYLYQWLGDPAVLRRYLPNAEAAMAWIDSAGDRDGDGFQEYATRSSHGYYNQGWKDAEDAIQHEDGAIAPLPLAVCELQGYAYDAKIRLATIYDILGQPEDGVRFCARPASSTSDQRSVLVGCRRDVLHGSRWTQAADPFRHVEFRPPALVRDRPSRPSGARGPPADGRRHVVGMGHQDALVRPSRLQPLQLPHGIGVAARQRDHRRRIAELWIARRIGPDRAGHVRRR